MSRKYTLSSFGAGARSTRLLAAALCVLFAAAQVPAQRTPIKTLSGGQLTITLDASFIQAARAAGITPIRTKPTRFRNGVLTMPISVGAIDRATGQIELVAPGGFAFNAGTTRVQLVNLIITVVPSEQVATLSAIVVAGDRNLGRVAIFDLRLPRIELPLTPDANGNLTIQGIQFTLSERLAQALNASFGSNAFSAGMPVGTSSITIRLGSPGDGF